MRVLVACEYSGRVREAFRKLGHDAVSCDLLPAEDGSAHHYQGDVRDMLALPWDLMIAHPPCTFLTIAAEWCYKDNPGKNMTPGVLFGEARRAAREEAADFVKFLWGQPIPRIAIENPRGVLPRYIGAASQTIQPHQFGEDASKATCLWLKGLPHLQPTVIVEPRLVCCGNQIPDGVGKYGCPNCLGEKSPRPRWANQTDSGQNRLAPSADRWKERSRTYRGIADAMAAQWGGPHHG